MPFPPPESFDLQEYVETVMPKTDTVDPMFETVIKYLRDELGIKRLGGVGYCFGGKYVCRFLKEGGLRNGGIDAGFTAHPSFVDAEEVRDIRGPLSIAAAGMTFNCNIRVSFLPFIPFIKPTPKNQTVETKT